jgi:Domain of unknown function (DU1801)
LLMAHPMPRAVATAFEAFPPAVRKRLERIRALILEAARTTDRAGPLTETLKWGEPAYLTEATGSGSTIRLGWPKAHRDHAAVYFNCKTALVPTFRNILPDAFRYEGNRALLVPLNGKIDEAALRLCIGMALTYHRKKKS